MTRNHYQEKDDISFKHLFVPLTVFKVMHFIIIIGFLAIINALVNEFVWDELIIYILIAY